METVREPLYHVVWEGKEVTRYLEDYSLSIEYTDNLHGKSDEIVMTFEDRDGNWKNAWFPQKGDKLVAKIGLREGGKDHWLNAGTFQIDELDFGGPPDVIQVKGLSTFMTEAQRQKRTRAWETVALSKVVAELAQKNGLKPMVEIDPDLRFRRLDQKNKSDLEFLKDLANKYGYAVKADSERLIFAKPDKLEKTGPVLTISSANLISSYRLTNTAHKTYKACEVRYWDPKTKKTVVHRHVETRCASGDELKLSERLENRQQAIERAKAELKKHNKFEISGDITFTGNTLLVAGANVYLDNLGHLSGKYLIEEARHSASKSNGYLVVCKVRRHAD